MLFADWMGVSGSSRGESVAVVKLIRSYFAVVDAELSDMRKQRKWRIVVHQHPVTATHLRALGRALVPDEKNKFF